MERAWKKPKTAKTTEMMIRIGKLKSSNRFILHTSFFSGGLRWVHGTDIRLYPDSPDCFSKRELTMTALCPSAGRN